MRALYSLLTRLRTLYALAQGIVAFVQTGRVALTPVQLLTLAFVLCIVLRVLTPGPPSARPRLTAIMDRVVTIVAAVSAAGLAAVSFAGACAFLAGPGLSILL